MSNFRPLTLAGIVADDFHIDSDDMRNAKQVLFEIGIYEPSGDKVTSERDRPFVAAIHRYQRLRDLIEDGKSRRAEKPKTTSIGRSVNSGRLTPRRLLDEQIVEDGMAVRLAIYAGGAGKN